MQPALYRIASRSTAIHPVQMPSTPGSTARRHYARATATIYEKIRPPTPFRFANEDDDVSVTITTSNLNTVKKRRKSERLSVRAVLEQCRGTKTMPIVVD